MNDYDRFWMWLYFVATLVFILVAHNITGDKINTIIESQCSQEAKDEKRNKI